MRKMKKINGYLIVKFNDREKRDYEELGTYGVIDAELYTGHLDVDRGALEYEDADSLDVAIEQTRGLDAEQDFSNEEPTFTLITETDEATHEETVEPQLMIAGWETQLKEQVDDRNYTDMDAHAAAHELHGFKTAFQWLGLLGDDAAFVHPNAFGPDEPTMAGFRHFPSGRKEAGLRLYELGVQLSRDCPLNDCVIYRNVFQMCRELDEQSDRLTGFPREVVDFTLQQRFLELKRLYDLNHAVREYRRSGAKKEPPVEGATPCGGCPIVGNAADVKKLGNLLKEVEDYTKQGTAEQDRRTPWYPGKPGADPYLMGKRSDRTPE